MFTFLLTFFSTFTEDYLFSQDNWGSGIGSYFCETSVAAVQYDTSTASAGIMAGRSCI